MVFLAPDSPNLYNNIAITESFECNELKLSDDVGHDWMLLKLVTTSTIGICI